VWSSSLDPASAVSFAIVADSAVFKGRDYAMAIVKLQRSALDAA
jgi:hypothetical protein